MAKATDLLIVATAAATKRTLYTVDTGQAELARGAGVPVETL
jgi:predicted nucleic acid-binding protein